MLGGCDPVRVDRAHLAGIGLAVPADQEALGDRARAVDLTLRDRRPAGPAGRLRHERERGHRRTREVVARLRVRDVDQRPQAELRTEQRQRRLHVDPRVGGVDGERVRLGRRQARLEAPVDEQAPHALERHRADQLLDVDPAVAQRAALAVGLCDPRLECIVVRRSTGGVSGDRRTKLLFTHLVFSLKRRAFAWLPQNAIEHQRRRAAGERS